MYLWTMARGYYLVYDRVIISGRIVGLFQYIAIAEG